VVLSDLAAEMTAIAAARAAALGLGNVRALTLDLDDLAQPDQAYDVALCREGLVFALDPAHAVAEIRRVLRPGGRGPATLAQRRLRGGRRPARHARAAPGHPRPLRPRSPGRWPTGWPPCPSRPGATAGRLTEAVRPYQTPTGLDFPGVSLLAAGRRP
jgi:SAM-dependent methyltransferase